MKLILMFLAVVGTSYAGTEMKEPIKVGVLLRFTPEVNSSAPSIFEGMQLAQKRFNENSKIKVELVKYPHKTGHESVVSAAKKIVKDKLQFVIGAEMSDDVFAMMEELRDRQIVAMSPTATHPLLTAGNPLLFRSCFSDDAIASEIAKFVASLKTTRSVGILHNTSNAYSDYISNAFLDAFEAKKDKSVKIVEFRYATEQPNFETAVAQFKKANVDTVIAFTLQDSVKNFHVSALKNNFSPVVVGSDGWGTNQSILKNIPDFKAIRYDYWNSDSKLAAVTRFKAEYEKEFKHAADSSSAAGYDAAIVLFEAIQKANELGENLTAVSVANVLHTEKFTGTVTAPTIRFGRTNTPKKALNLYEFKNNTVKFLKAVE